MNLKSTVLEHINYRINQEEISSRLYKSMAVFLDNQGYLGAAKLFTKYSQEELVHAEFSYDYLSSLNILPELKAIPAPSAGISNFKDLANIVKLSLAHEEEITLQCNKFAKVCLDHNDFVTLTLAQKYCAEQIEEISKMQKWTDRIKVFGTTELAMRELDEEMEEAAQ